MTNEEIFERLEKGSFVSVTMNNEVIISGHIEDMCYIKPMDFDGYYLFKVAYKDMIFELDSRKIMFNIWIENVDGKQILHYELDKRIEEEKKDLLMNLGFDKEKSGLGNVMTMIMAEWDDCPEEKKKDYISLLSKYDFGELMEDIICAMKNDKKHIEKLSGWKIEKLDDEISFLEKYNEFKENLPRDMCKIFDYLLYKTWGLKLK